MYFSSTCMKHPNQKIYLWQFWCLRLDIFLARKIGKLKLAANFTAASSCCFGNHSLIYVMLLGVLLIHMASRIFLAYM